MSKRIGIITNQFPTISETFIVNKVLGLADAGMKVFVCVGTGVSDIKYFSRSHDFRKIKIVNVNSRSLIALNLLIHPIKALLWFIQLKKNWSFLNSFRILLKGFVISLQRFDIIHFEFSGIGVAHLDLLEFYKPAKTFVSCRGTAEYVTPILTPWRGIELAKLFSAVDRIHCVSGDILKEIVKYGALPEKSFINRPAIRPELEQPLHENIEYDKKTKILSVGRLTFQKGYVYALLAIRELVKAYPDIEYHIVGQGPDLAEIKFFIEKNGLQSVIFLHGALSYSEVLTLLNSSDIFLLSSVCEGIANSVLEAMFHSMPVVSTRIGGIEEVVKDGYNGILTESYDSSAIKSGLEKVLVNRELRETLGKNAHTTIKDQFLLDRQIKIFLEEYN